MGTRGHQHRNYLSLHKIESDLRSLDQKLLEKKGAIKKKITDQSFHVKIIVIYLVLKYQILILK